jgi:hypothetical protein
MEGIITPKRINEVFLNMAGRMIIKEQAQAIITQENQVLLVDEMWVEEKESFPCPSCQAEALFGVITLADKSFIILCPQCNKVNQFSPN